MKILFASSNRGKFKEAERFASSFGVELVSPDHVIGTPPVVEEIEDSYLGNARLKAEAYMGWSGLPAVADDTGLEVQALGGEPGLYTARYAGPHCSAEDNCRKLLSVLDGNSVRGAKFVCALFLAYPDGSSLQAQEELSGEIAKAPSGAGGFGYDPVFVVDQHQKTLADIKALEMPIETHRTKALRSLFTKLGALP